MIAWLLMQLQRLQAAHMTKKRLMAGHQPTLTPAVSNHCVQTKLQRQLMQLHA